MFVVVIADEIPASFVLSSIGLKHLHSKWKGHFRSKVKEQKYSKPRSQECWGGFFSLLYKNVFSKPGLSKYDNVWQLAILSVSAEWAHVKSHEEAASELLTLVSE